MHDQWVKTGSALGIENPRDRTIRPRIAAQAIDRFGWQGDQPANAQLLHRRLWRTISQNGQCRINRDHPANEKRHRQQTKISRENRHNKSQHSAYAPVRPSA